MFCDGRANEAAISCLFLPEKTDQPSEDPPGIRLQLGQDLFVIKSMNMEWKTRYASGINMAKLMLNYKNSQPECHLGSFPLMLHR